MVSVCLKTLSESIKYCIIIIFFPLTNMKFGGLHCKYIRPHYDGTLAIHRSSTTIHCRDQLQCIIWKFLIFELRSCYQCTGSYAILYIWRITILDCNVYNESNLTSYYQLTWDFGIKVKIFIKATHKEGVAY